MQTTSRLTVTLLALAVSGAALAQQTTGKAPHAGHAMPAKVAAASGPIDPGATLDPGLGKLHIPVSTKSKPAQAWFDQGMKLVYGFNHEAAINCFKRAAEADKDLAMAYWGIAYALGPNYNFPMSPEAHAAAYEAVQKAVALKGKASKREQAYIDALATRYAADPKADVAPLSEAYAKSMAALAQRFANDNDAQVLYAESLMDLRPWHLWTPDGKPEEGTPQIIKALERVLARDPNHMGANHYYVHAMEMSPTPEKALPSAQRLERLAPSAGHLMHMPAHTYIRTGRYLDAAKRNEVAAAADERLRAAGVQGVYTIGYYGHNLHFLSVSYAMAGNAAKSIAAANKLAVTVEPAIKEVPFLDAYLATPPQILTMFERWDEVLALKEPPFEAPITGAMWHFARALAFGAKGQTAEAQAERAKLAEAAKTIPSSMDWGTNKAADVLAVALPYVDGRLALMAKDHAAAAKSLREAAAAEAKLSYDEPPQWYLASNLWLGQALLASGDAAGAEAAFRADLKHNVEHGRSLQGLALALRAQNRKRDAEAVRSGLPKPGAAPTSS